MAWYDSVTGLTPVHAWDAIGYLGGDVPDKVGSATLSSNGTRVPVSDEYLGVSANGNPLTLPSSFAPAPDSVLVFFARYYSEFHTHSGFGLIGFSDGGAGQFTNHTNEASPGLLTSNVLITNNSSTGWSYLSQTMRWGIPVFTAVVFSAAGTGRAYVNGGWGGDAIARSKFPGSVARIGDGFGSPFQLNTPKEHLIAAGYFTGTPTLAQLQALENAAREQLAAPGVFVRNAGQWAPVSSVSVT